MKWSLYRKNGQIWKEQNYKDGKRDGKWTDYYEDGQIKSEVNYKDGERDGKWTDYYEDGQIKNEGNYKDGEKDGKWTLYRNKEIESKKESESIHIKKWSSDETLGRLFRYEYGVKWKKGEMFKESNYKDGKLIK